MEKEILLYQSLINDLKALIEEGRNSAYAATNKVIIETYWNIGRRIVEEEQDGEERAAYKKQLINTIAEELTKEYGKSYSSRNLYYYRKFYQYFPDREILNTRVQNLNWSHFRTLLRVPDEDARIWYMNEASKEGWSSRTLDRNISTQYYYRLLQSPKREAVISEMKRNTQRSHEKQYELIKSPVVAEFLGFKNEDTYLETDEDIARYSVLHDNDACLCRNI